jgi:hypothetical protein
MFTTRLLLTLAITIGFVPAVLGAVSLKKDRSVLDPESTDVAARLSSLNLSQAAGPASKSDYVMTDRTEVFVDGQPCAYERVPPQARIVKIDVAANQRTVLKIYFKTQK